jgi:hypothetical protein
MRGIARNRSLTTVERAKRIRDLERQKAKVIEAYQTR